MDINEVKAKKKQTSEIQKERGSRNNIVSYLLRPIEHKSSEILFEPWLNFLKATLTLMEVIAVFFNAFIVSKIGTVGTSEHPTKRIIT